MWTMRPGCWISSRVFGPTRLDCFPRGKPNNATTTLSGTISPSLSKLQFLDGIYLTDLKDLTGPFPSFLFSLPKLLYVYIENNKLSGPIPRNISKSTQLEALSLEGNRFSGPIPSSIFNLDLSHNSLVDPFPNMQVKGIESLDLSYNQFHLKSIPQWVASSPIIFSLKLAKCGIKISLDDWKPKETYFYDYIDLSENEITGSPVKILNRTDFLVGFHASGNKLKFNLGSMRFVKTLKDLDLSRNSVFGKVPPAVSGLAKLNVSYNHLCGQLPRTKFPADSFVGNDCLCGSPLPKCK